MLELQHSPAFLLGGGVSCEWCDLELVKDATVSGGWGCLLLVFSSEAVLLRVCVARVSVGVELQEFVYQHFSQWAFE